MITISHSIVKDTKIIFQTLLRKKWLDKHGYIYFFFNKDKQTKRDYKKIINDLRTKVEESTEIKTLLDKQKTWQVYLTKFGTYGSYELPNKIILNTRRNSVNEIFETFIHELVHLQIEKESSKKSLSHETKEKLVEEIVKNLRARAKRF